MTPQSQAIEQHAFRLYHEFARVPLEQAEYRWAKKVSAKVKEQFRAEAITELNEETIRHERSSGYRCC